MQFQRSKVLFVLATLGLSFFLSGPRPHETLPGVMEVEARSGSSVGGGGFRSSSSSSSSSTRSRSTSSSPSTSPSRSSRPPNRTVIYENGSDDPFAPPGKRYDRYDRYHHHDVHDGEPRENTNAKVVRNLLTPRMTMVLLVLAALAMVMLYLKHRPGPGSRKEEEAPGFGGEGSVSGRGALQSASPLISPDSFAAPTSFGHARPSPLACAALLELAMVDPHRTIQHHLEAMGNAADFSTPDGLRRFLDEIIVLVRRQAQLVEQGRVLSSQGDLSQVEGAYRGWLSEARSKFDRDILRRQGAHTYRAGVRNMGQDNALLDEDGDFEPHHYIVLSLGVAWQHGAAMSTKLDSHQDLLARLNELGAISTSQLMALEIVWSPSAESDAMGKSDMLATYPELRPL